MEQSTNKKIASRIKSCLLAIVLSLLTLIFVLGYTNAAATELEEPPVEEVVLLLDTMELNYDNFLLACEQLEIHHAEIVYAQARLESGNFTSRLYREYNNMLGLYNSNQKDYYKFNHWSDCLLGYKNSVQYKYVDGDYYQFLADLPYAMDEQYIRKLQRLVE